MQDTWGFAHFLENTDGVARLVLCALVCGSIVSWYLIVQRVVQQLRQHRRSHRFLQTFGSAREWTDITQALQRNTHTEPFSQLVAQGLKALETWPTPETTALERPRTPAEEPLTRALRRTIEACRHEQESGQTWLATVASSAPFVGLLGTVWGIYHALIAIGAAGQSTLDKVAGPVGEALIMTGIGLAVAIPAAMAYNAFARSSRNTLVRLTAFADEVHYCLVCGVLPATRQALASQGKESP